LTIAAANGQLACIDLLLAGRANVHLKVKDGCTALDMAISYKHPAV
jgi:ankyrin repeat protein